MNIAAVIPARYASSRFPGKPLAQIAGRSMIEWVYRRTVDAGCYSEVLVATDDARIFEEVERFGGLAVMTSTLLGSGSERVWTAISNRPDIQAVANVQGDEPLIPAELLREIYRLLEADQAPVISAVTSNSSFQDFLSPHVVKAVMDESGQALFFSRAPIPFQNQSNFHGFHQHIGVYGYRRDALESFVSHRPTPLEKLEKLEQLRFLENQVPIHLVETGYRAHGVDVPEDVHRIESILRGKT